MNHLPTFQNTPETTALIVPHNREAEEGLLGSIFIYPDVYLEVATFLQADNFFIHRHRWIWEAITHLHEERTPVDFLTIVDAVAGLANGKSLERAS